MSAKEGTNGLCPICGKECPGYDQLKERRWLHEPLWDFAVYLVYRVRRVECPEHGIHAEALPWGDGKNHVTVSMMIFLASWAKRLSWSETAKLFQVDWRKVYESVKYVVEYGMLRRVIEGIRAIGVDEIHWGKGKKAGNYVTMVYQLDAGQRRLLSVEQGRSARSLWKALRSLGTDTIGKIEFVCSDMWKPYLQVIRERLPKSVNILDRFHVCSHVNKAVDETRRSEVTRLAGKPSGKKLKKMRFTLLKSGKRVRGKARSKLNALIRRGQATARAWLLKESFGHFWTYISPHCARKFLREWCSRASRSRIQPMIKVAKMLTTHTDLLINWFHAKKQFSNSITEGLNNKARACTRRAYGHRTFHVMQLSLFHTLGNLPEPPKTHRFC